VSVAGRGTVATSRHKGPNACADCASALSRPPLGRRHASGAARFRARGSFSPDHPEQPALGGRAWPSVIYDEKRFSRGNKKYRKTPGRTQFLDREMKYIYPAGWLYPLYAAFRFLAAPNETGKIVWREDPIEFWKKHGSKISESFLPHISQAGYDVKKIATNPLCYQAVRQTVTDLFKDELLQKAGIAV
jgi:hypothetical protein